MMPNLAASGGYTPMLPKTNRTRTIAVAFERRWLLMKSSIPRHTTSTCGGVLADGEDQISSENVWRCDGSWERGKGRDGVRDARNKHSVFDHPAVAAAVLVRCGLTT